jgi:thiamine-phosphate pyrophosphorylase
MKLKGLYPIIDIGVIEADRALRVTQQIIDAGVKIFQLRAKSLPGGEFLKLAAEMARLARKTGVKFIVNNRADIAYLAQADGVHLGHDDLTLAAARKILGEDKLVGLSSHSLAEAVDAQGQGADYVAFGPIFPTTTKPDAQRPKGLEALREIRLKIKLPLVAIGGIREETAAQVIAAGADMLAVISDLLEAADVGEKAKRFMALFRQG